MQMQFPARIQLALTMVALSCLWPFPSLAQDGPGKEKARQEEQRKTENAKRESERRAPEMIAAQRNAKESFYEARKDAPTTNADLQRAIQKDKAAVEAAGNNLNKSGVKENKSTDVTSPTVPNVKSSTETGGAAQGKTPGR